MVYQASRFYIEVLFWFSGTTAIHDHSFSGAFAVLAGSSVHSHWRFERSAIVNSRMLTGHLERISTDILRPGDVQPIYSGDRLIHQLFHLEMPSVTIVVRTYVDRHHLPQYQYMMPGLAIDEKDRDGTRTRRMFLLDAMVRGEINGLREYFDRLIEQGDIETIYQSFLLLARRKVEPQLVDALYASARQVHGKIVDLFRQVCAWERRNRVVMRLRTKISEPEPRFLLALLMLMPNRAAIFEAIGLQFPGTEPLAMIETWLTSMSKETIGFNFDDVNRILFRGLVEGCDEESLLQRLNGEFSGNSISEHRDQLLKHVKKIAASDLFYPLFSQNPLRGQIGVS